jgi:nitroreductase
MGDVMAVIKERRSIRKYQEKEVPEAVLNRVFEAVRWAPSWNNTQCWDLVVVKERENRKKLFELMPSINPARKALLQAPVVIALCGRTRLSGFYSGQPTTKFGDWYMFDLGIAAQNLCLAAHTEGLGTVIAGLFDHDRTKDLLGLPEDFEVVALIPMGYPAHESSAPKRREITDFTHAERF